MNLATVAQASTVVSLAMALVTLAMERRRRQRLEADRRRQTWATISKVVGLMTDLERKDDTGVKMAIGKLSFMMRDLIRDACSEEPTMDINKVREWRELGKLSSDWHEYLAIMCLQGDELTGERASELKNHFSNISALPTDHEMSTPWINRTLQQDKLLSQVENE